MKNSLKNGKRRFTKNLRDCFGVANLYIAGVWVALVRYLVNAAFTAFFGGLKAGIDQIVRVVGVRGRSKERKTKTVNAGHPPIEAYFSIYEPSLVG